MRFLLDTHCWIWSVESPARLNQRARTVLLDVANTGFVSAATIWELAIKARIGKLRLTGGLHELLSEAFAGLGFEPLPIQQAHAVRTLGLPLHHRDPFDRMLVAQAQVERLTLVTADAEICRYEVDVLWAGSGEGPPRGGAGWVAESSVRAGKRPTTGRRPTR